MKTIQIAPYKRDCKIDGHKVLGTMGNRTFCFEIPEQYEIPEEIHDSIITNFCQAIALSSKCWQVERLLNDTFQIDGGKFYEI